MSTLMNLIWEIIIDLQDIIYSGILIILDVYSVIIMTDVSGNIRIFFFFFFN